MHGWEAVCGTPRLDAGLGEQARTRVGSGMCQTQNFVPPIPIGKGGRDIRDVPPSLAKSAAEGALVFIAEQAHRQLAGEADAGAR